MHEIYHLKEGLQGFMTRLCCYWTDRDKSLPAQKWDEAARTKYFSGEMGEGSFKVWRGYPAKGLTATMYLHGVLFDGDGEGVTLLVRARPNRTLRMFPLIALVMALIVLNEVFPHMSMDKPIAFAILLMVPVLVFALIWFPMRNAFRWEGRKLMTMFKELVLGL